MAVRVIWPELAQPAACLGYARFRAGRTVSQLPCAMVWGERYLITVRTQIMTDALDDGSRRITENQQGGSYEVVEDQAQVVLGSSGTSHQISKFAALHLLLRDRRSGFFIRSQPLRLVVLSTLIYVTKRILQPGVAIAGQFLRGLLDLPQKLVQALRNPALESPGRPDNLMEPTGL